MKLKITTHIQTKQSLMQKNCNSNIHWGRRFTLYQLWAKKALIRNPVQSSAPGTGALRMSPLSWQGRDAHCFSHSLWRGHFTHSLDASFNSSPAPTAWAAASTLLGKKIFESHTNCERVAQLTHPTRQDSEFICFKMNTVCKSSSGIQLIAQSQALELANNWHKKITIQQPNSLLNNFPLWEGQGLSLSLCW